MTERPAINENCLYKDKSARPKSHLFVLERTNYIYNYAVASRGTQATHFLVSCSIPKNQRISLRFVPGA